jgi:hypothetical protein
MAKFVIVYEIDNQCVMAENKDAVSDAIQELIENTGAEEREVEVYELGKQYQVEKSYKISPV